MSANNPALDRSPCPHCCTPMVNGLCPDPNCAKHWPAREVLPSNEKTLRAALERIAKWFGEFPDTGRTWDDGSPMSYAACYGSNGERDYMRQIARVALESTQFETFVCREHLSKPHPACPDCARAARETGTEHHWLPNAAGSFTCDFCGSVATLSPAAPCVGRDAVKSSGEPSGDRPGATASGLQSTSEPTSTS